MITGTKPIKKSSASFGTIKPKYTLGSAKTIINNDKTKYFPYERQLNTAATIGRER
ncbi:hypothetical protein D3C85_779330 [compost metagenome]